MLTHAYSFSTLDVFTDVVFGGNPLAVFPDAQGLTDEQMQAVARELNLSETVFVLPAASPDALRRLRIFTPGVELPFAGHPTVGAAVLLSELGIAPADGSFVLEEAVGLVAVTVSTAQAGPPAATLAAAVRPTVAPPPVQPWELARMLRLAPDDLVEAAGAPALASAGVPFVVVAVRDLDALGRADMDASRWPSALTGHKQHVYVITPPDAGHLRARMFAPDMNIREDPATGAAASAVAGLLAQGAGDGTHRWTITQGVEMGRPSRLEIAADVSRGEVVQVRVGGQAVRVADGVFRLPG